MNGSPRRIVNVGLQQSLKTGNVHTDDEWIIIGHSGFLRHYLRNNGPRPGVIFLPAESCEGCGIVGISRRSKGFSEPTLSLGGIEFNLDSDG
jgi:hypothetical protein